MPTTLLEHATREGFTLGRYEGEYFLTEARTGNTRSFDDPAAARAFLSGFTMARERYEQI